MQVAIPSLSNLHTQRLVATDVYIQHGTKAESKNWRLEFKEHIKSGKLGVVSHVISISGSEGAVDRQLPVLAELNERFNPLFAANGWAKGHFSGELFTTCRDHTKSTLEWSFSKQVDGPVPEYGIPPESIMPTGGVDTLLQAVFGAPPVELAGVQFTWELDPRVLPAVSSTVYYLRQAGDAAAPAEETPIILTDDGSRMNNPAPSGGY